MKGNMEARKDYELKVETRDFGIIWKIPASILHKSIAGRYRPVRVADGPITARYRFMKNAYWDSRYCDDIA